MPSLMELVDRVNRGEVVDAGLLAVYQESANSAERFLAHHARAMLDLRQAHQHLLQSLEAIDYSDQKVLNQFISVSTFLGQLEQRAQPVIRFGGSALARRELALGLEAIQNGVWYDLRHGGGYLADRQNWQFIASQYQRAAESIGWTGPRSLEWNNSQIRVAFIASSLSDDDASARTARGLARHHDSRRFGLHVYSTEAAVRRDKRQFGLSSYAQPSARRGAQTLECLSIQKVPTWIAPTDGDLVAAATDLAARLIADRIDVAIIDATPADAIASLIANWSVAQVKVNLCRRVPLFGSDISCIVYVDQVRYEADKDYLAGRGIESKFILEGIDIDEDFGPAPLRSAYGIPDQAIVLATAGHDLDRTISEPFVQAIIHTLRAYPEAVYLLMGEGELGWQKRKFEAAGVAKRIGYAGRRKDLPGFLQLADIYVAELPCGSAAGVLQAMAVEKPVVAMRWGEGADQSQAAALAGPQCAIIGRDPNLYIERLDRLIREEAYRQKLGRTMRWRVEQHFGFTQTAAHLQQLCEQLVQRSTQAPAIQITFEDQSVIKAA